MKKLQILYLIPVMVLMIQCGYHLSGGGNAIPSTVKTVYISDIKNETAFLNFERSFKTILIDQFRKKSSLRLDSNAGTAHSNLICTILNMSANPVLENEEIWPQTFKINISFSITFINQLSREIIYENSRLAYNGNYKSHHEDFFNHPSKSLNEFIEDAAKHVVSNIAENF